MHRLFLPILVLAATQFPVTLQHMPMDGRELSLRMHANAKATYLTRARSIGSEKPPITSLKPVLATLQKGGYLSGERSGNNKNKRDMSESPSILKMRLPGTNNVGVAIRLSADAAAAEETFVRGIMAIALVATPGSPDGKLIGDNSAYWFSQPRFRIYFYANNATVSLSCTGSPSACSDHARFVEQALRNVTSSQ